MRTQEKEAEQKLRWNMAKARFNRADIHTFFSSIQGERTESSGSCILGTEHSTRFLFLPKLTFSRTFPHSILHTLLLSNFFIILVRWRKVGNF